MAAHSVASASAAAIMNLGCLQRTRRLPRRVVVGTKKQLNLAILQKKQDTLRFHNGNQFNGQSLSKTHTTDNVCAYTQLSFWQECSTE